MLNQKSRNPNRLDDDFDNTSHLENEISPQAQSQSRLRFLLRVFPWFIIWMAIQGVGQKVSQLTGSYSERPVLVQVGRDAKPIMAVQSSEGRLNAANVTQFAAEVMPLLYRVDSKLPAEMGGGKDPGIKVGENQIRVPTPMFLAKAALSPDISDGFLVARMKRAPKDLWDGAAQTIQGLQVGEVMKDSQNPNIRTVVVSGLLVTDAPDGSPREAQRWARKLTIQSVQEPVFLLQKSAIEEKYNLFLARGLLITGINDALDVLPPK